MTSLGWWALVFAVVLVVALALVIGFLLGACLAGAPPWVAVGTFALGTIVGAAGLALIAVVSET